MEIWYDDATKEVKAIYSHRYSGTVWPDAGYLSLETSQRPSRTLAPGAIIQIADGVAEVVTPPPPREPTAEELRRAALADKLRTRTATTDEIQEFLVLREG